jgi:hypothetical protein
LEVTVGEKTFLDGFQRININSTDGRLPEAHFKELVVTVKVEKEVCGLLE